MKCDSKNVLSYLHWNYRKAFNTENTLCQDVKAYCKLLELNNEINSLFEL